jgi:hypothetical protein
MSATISPHKNTKETTAMPILQDLRAEIEKEKQDRILEHQARIAANKRMAPMFAKQLPRLNLFAQGDSWYDYPFPVPKIDQSDVIAHLRRLPSKSPEVLSLAHYGLATEQMMGTKRHDELVAQLSDKNNGDFDAILFSGGGDDIAGDQFRLWLNNAATTPVAPLNSIRLGAILEVIEAGYQDLIEARDSVDKSIPIFVHSYDFAIPDNRGVACAGPWLHPGFSDRGWEDLEVNTGIVKSLLQQFSALLDRLAAVPANNLIHVQTQGTLKGVGQWANELHPTPEGFAAITAVFVQALALKFPGRIG